jgi:hypothetical protein
MKFKLFLEAANVPYKREYLKYDALVEALTKNCSQALAQAAKDKDSRIWRGTTNLTGSGVFYPDTGTRQSANTSNFYTELLDSNIYNAHYPKRSKSFICSTSQDVAEGFGYGDNFAVFPFDNAKIGVVNESDLWLLELDFKIFKEGIETMNYTWKSLIGYDQSITMKDLVDNVKKMSTDELINGLLHRHKKDWDESEYPELAHTFKENIQSAYSYDNLGCDVVPIGRLKQHDSEVWFSDPCVMVRYGEDLDKINKEFGLK